MSFALKLKELTSEQICEVIVTFRCIGLLKDESKMAMVELLNRKKNGDLFDYNQYINQKISEFPKLKPVESFKLFNRAISNEKSRNS